MIEEVFREKIEGRKERISELFFLLHLCSAKLEQKSSSLVTTDDDRDFPLRKEEAAKKVLNYALFCVFF